MEGEVANIYGHKVRVRATGILVKENQLLMVNHTGITTTNFWSPPGGGIEFDHTIQRTLIREFLEETGLQIETGKFMFGCEYIQHPLHAIELFFHVVGIGGQLKTGADPEIQIINDVQFIEFNEIKKMPSHEVHGIFRLADTLTDLNNLSGFYRI